MVITFPDVTHNFFIGFPTRAAVLVHYMNVLFKNILLNLHLLPSIFSSFHISALQQNHKNHLSAASFARRPLNGPPFTPPCSSRSSQTSTRAPWGRRLSVGSGCWLPGRQWAGNGSDLQTRSAWSAPLPFCLWSTAQGSLERQMSRLKIGDHEEKLNLQS